MLHAQQGGQSRLDILLQVLRTDMTGRVYNVLFLCTGNTARSVLAEGILRKEGAGRFNAFSAGSQPKGVVNPFALKVLAAHGYPADGFRSKSWSEFAKPSAPKMDFVFTVCDSAAGESCPLWPGQPITAHWGIEDPAAVDGSDIDKERAFNAALGFMRNRVGAFIALPLSSIDAMLLATRLKDIGRMDGASATGDGA
jgi:arsenate reductase (thioredoxin)